MTDALLDDYRRELVARYRNQVEVFRRHMAALDDRALRAPIKPGEWSPHQVVFHSAAVDQQAYGPRLGRILREDRPQLDDFDGDRWMAEHYEPSEPVGGMLDRWQALRQENAALVEAVPPTAWNRTGRQSFWGERTLQWWVERAVEHADEHLRQLRGE